MDADRNRARLVHDLAGTCAFLRGLGAGKEHSFRAYALRGRSMPGLGSMDRGGIFLEFRRFQSVDRRPEPGLPHRCRAGRGASGNDDPRHGLHHVPDDVRHHHAGADHRRLCRAHQIFGGSGVLGPVAGRRLRPCRPLGVGRRMACGDGRQGLRGRHRRAHDGRRIGGHHRPRTWQARGFPAARAAAACAVDRHGRRRPCCGSAGSGSMPVPR